MLLGGFLFCLNVLTLGLIILWCLFLLEMSLYSTLKTNINQKFKFLKHQFYSYNELCIVIDKSWNTFFSLINNEFDKKLSLYKKSTQITNIKPPGAPCNVNNFFLVLSEDLFNMTNLTLFGFQLPNTVFLKILICRTGRTTENK